MSEQNTAQSKTPLTDALSTFLVDRFPATLGNLELHRMLTELGGVETELGEEKVCLENLGVCTKCLSPLVHSIAEPFANCNCGTSEWAFSDLSEQPLLIRNQFDLAAAVGSVLKCRDLLDPNGQLSVKDAASKLHEQLARVTRERDEVNVNLANASQTGIGLVVQVQNLTRERDSLKILVGRLKQYSPQHLPTCNQATGSCTCGLTEALKEVEKVC